MQDLGNALERTFADLVIAAAPGLSVTTGQSQDDLSLPQMTIWAQDGREMPQDSGNFMVTVNCELRANADDTTLPDFRTLSATAFAPLMSDGLASEASGATGFHAFGITERQMRANVQDRSYISTLSMNVYCCLTDAT